MRTTALGQVGILGSMTGVLTAALICVVLYAVALLALVVAGRGRDAAAYARLVPDAARLFARLVQDPQVPRGAKLLIALGLGYLALPFDLVPDFIPVVGVLDDALVVALVMRVALAAAGPVLVARHWPGPTQTLRLALRAAGAPGPLSKGGVAAEPTRRS